MKAHLLFLMVDELLRGIAKFVSSTTPVMNWVVFAITEVQPL